MVNSCIYCKGDSSSSKSKEHIVPESMGCPENMYLEPGIVCDRCNNNVLAGLDEALQNSFGLLRIFHIAQNKKGKPLTVKNKYCYAENNNGHIAVHINAGGPPVEIKKGVVLKTIEGDKRNIHSLATMKMDGFMDIKFSQNLVFNDKAKRGLHKIAFEFYCWVHGKEEVLSDKFDSVREYIIKGLDQRNFLMSEKYSFENMNGIHEFQNIAIDEQGNIVVPFNLFNMTFVVLLCGTMQKLYAIQKKAKEMLLPEFVML